MKKIFTFIVFVLLGVLLVGGFLQLFLPEGKKITDWINRQQQIEVGDKVKVLYVNPYIDDEELDYTLASLDWSDATSFGGGVGQQLVLIAFESKDTDVKNIYLYATRTRSYGGYNTSGWASYSLSVSYNWNILNYGDEQSSMEFNPYVMTVTEVYQQEVWKNCISKLPF